MRASQWPARALAALLLLLACGPLLSPRDPLLQDRDHANLAPDRSHLLGTDDYGRDVLSRFLAGGAWSIGVGGAATLLVLGLGSLIGCVAGYRGGWIDLLTMRAGDLFLSVPWLYALIGLRAVLPLTIKPRPAVALLLLAIALVSWPRPARLVRGMVLSLSQRGYVEAARGFGVREAAILWKHITPDTWPLLAAQALVLFPRFVLAEVTLSFLGLGAGQPDPSWGEWILGLKQAYLLHDQWWRLLPVCLMVPLFALCAMAARGISREPRR